MAFSSHSIQQWFDLLLISDQLQKGMTMGSGIWLVTPPLSPFTHPTTESRNDD